MRVWRIGRKWWWCSLRTLGCLGSQPEQGVELAGVGVDEDGPVEFMAGAGKAVGPQCLSDGGVGGELLEARDQIFDGVFLRKKTVPAIPDDAWDAAGIGRDDREAGSVGFAKGAAHGFHICEAGAGIGVDTAGEDEGVGGVEVRRELVVGDVTEEVSVRLELETFD